MEIKEKQLTIKVSFKIYKNKGIENSIPLFYLLNLKKIIKILGGNVYAKLESKLYGC